MKPFLTQYSIRSKQSYIFQTNRLREVTGASALIAGAFDRLLSCARDIGLKVLPADPGASFSLQETLVAFEDGSLQVVELFRGGGNDTLLMDSEDTFRRVNEAFTRDLLANVPGMIPLCVGVPMGENRKYNEDYQALSLASGMVKSTMISGLASDTLPFALLDAVTHQPFQPERPLNAPSDRRYTASSLAKRKMYVDEKLVDENVDQLDHLLDAGDSMLAIVHADGNNMGAKLRNLLGDNVDYDSCVTILRKFSQEIDDVFVNSGDQAIRAEKAKILEEEQKKAEAAGKKFNPNNKFLEVRCVVSDGDDYTFICNARWALRLTRAYLNSVSAHEGYSACAGICIFHRHYPFARAYDLAEQACESAKKKVHTADRPDQCWIDFHYLHGGVPDDLEETRAAHGTAGIQMRPWRCDNAEDPTSIDRLIALRKEMVSSAGDQGRTTRTNLKAVGTLMESSVPEARNEMERIYFRAPALKEKLQQLFPEEDRLLKAIYDLSEVYDIWFEGRA